MGTLSSWPERLSSNKKRVMQELVQGQEFATQLQILFSKPSEQGGRLVAKELVQKILRSFDETLSVLTSVESVEVSQATSTDDSPCCVDRRSEDSGESRKRPASKDKRGCYKRKRSVQSWTVVSATTEDSHAWRKYGQKEILNSKHPRSYFRCTRKYDQGCRATKQVQRKEDDPHMYQITYIGTHTCIDSFKAPQIITDSESYMVTYGGSKTPTKRQYHHELNNPTTLPTAKQETKEEITTPSDLTDMETIMWKDIIGGGFEYSYENGYPSNEITSRNLELDFVIKPAEFENDFQFDENECLV
ncbi:hypothetical protein DITRI_Ditri20bG0117800 [Diplodiscus trichospermus]